MVEFTDPETYGQLSKFNEGAYQMMRIHELQSRINLANINPLIFYPEENFYGYEIIFNSINSIFKEVSTKCSNIEKGEAIRMRKRLLVFMREHPIHKLSPNKVSHIKEKVLDRNSWRIIKEELNNYELFVRGLLGKHKIDSPVGDRPEEAAYK